ncbi:uncharacterized protein G2W53_038620 [Senna tora]|uniref:Uncharacterized protein n=1 Tax=Senna tora TaxID=362788 RepID=A0A834SZR8_9FABA|nr:uncharacterized protein G2W53_038620 [Senna tora]
MASGDWRVCVEVKEKDFLGVLVHLRR